MIRSLLPVALILTALLIPACKKKEPPTSYGKLEWKDESFYLKGEPFNGVAQDLHPNGQTRAEYPMKNGKPHGIVREWWDNGQPSAETYFENGQRHGSNRYWSREGKLLKEQVYDHDKSVSEKVYPSTPPAAAK